MSKKQWIIELAMPAAFILMAAYVAVQSLSIGRSPVSLCSISAVPDAEEAAGGRESAGGKPENGGNYAAGSAGVCVPAEKDRLCH